MNSPQECNILNSVDILNISMNGKSFGSVAECALCSIYNYINITDYYSILRTFFIAFKSFENHNIGAANESINFPNFLFLNSDYISSNRYEPNYY